MIFLKSSMWADEQTSELLLLMLNSVCVAVCSEKYKVMWLSELFGDGSSSPLEDSLSLIYSTSLQEGDTSQNLGVNPPARQSSPLPRKVYSLVLKVSVDNLTVRF